MGGGGLLVCSVGCPALPVRCRVGGVGWQGVSALCVGVGLAGGGWGACWPVIISMCLTLICNQLGEGVQKPCPPLSASSLARLARPARLRVQPQCSQAEDTMLKEAIHALPAMVWRLNRTRLMVPKQKPWI